MLSSQAIATAIRGKLLSNPYIVEKVGNRVFRLHADDQAPYPYIVMRWNLGGDDNESAFGGFDQMWLVFAVSDSHPESELIASYISDTLKNADINYPDSFYSYAPVRQMNPYEDSITAQGQTFWAVGAYFRFRATRG